jgi:HSP20 family protein
MWAPARDFNDIVDDFFGSTPWPSPARSLAADTFKIDVEDSDDAYIITAELPGIDKKDVDVDMGEDGRLTIAVTHETTTDDSDEKKNYIHRERQYAAMSRSIYLGDIDPQGISAKLADGILTLTAAKKAPEKKATKISID